MAQRKSKNSGVPHGLIAGILTLALIFVTVTFSILWMAFPRDSNRDLLTERDGNNYQINPLTAGHNAIRPKSSRVTDKGEIEAPILVDELWPKLMGKWEVFPNPDIKSTYEFYSDYSYSSWQAGKGEPGYTVRKVVSGIQDRTYLGLAWNVIYPEDSHYLLVYETPKNVYESGTMNVNADGTISMGDFRYWRVSPSEIGGVKLPSLKDLYWAQLAGRKWSRHNEFGEHIMQFGKDGSISIDEPLELGDKSVKKLRGKVVGLRITPEGYFYLQLGRYVQDGRTVQQGELGEFFFMGKQLRHNNLAIFTQKPPGSQ